MTTTQQLACWLTKALLHSPNQPKDIVCESESMVDMLADSSSDACSWLYLSRLAAMKEYAFMVALGEHGLPVPYAVAHNRHCVLMTMVDAVPLVQVCLY